jgi:hypothetical protein
MLEPDGTLRLAFVLVQRGRGEWAGYVLNHERDALFAIRRDGAAIELRATEGAAEWALMWKLDAPDAHPQAQSIEPPQPLAREEYAELERLAQDFVGEWIWLREAPAAETAIERERYARYGYIVRDANVRVARLQHMRGDADVTQPLLHSTLDAEHDWIRAVLQRCWA